ncbi:hypothetical protein CEUSTIGMA_g5592.t1 [Chlamydomonas eustigma]|uniref:Suppressor of forked domain-containing protein n=1 Tax=Chlamydomonas eustigma TaxID=1157962 RepID=A0A250X5W5_9CHLO|nr:hypothetical protein CEUSTIGMA_g5592.t1 [Chlamydomonas eustigma]|eukprot:GAX78150.1 hypothetical protein CEUSTIGMA_g5592.t1 [Chlamydomonas eustigma]
MCPARVLNPSKGDASDDLMPSDEDLLYEEELLRNPYNLKMWCRYLQARTDAPARRRYLLYERAIRSLPGSYKLWYAYLRERRVAVRGSRMDSPAVQALNNTYERSLVSMHKMPRVWLDYLEFLMDQKLVTLTRHTFDRAMTALPITQHDRIWELYLKFIRQPGMPVDTAIRVYRRYLKLEPTHTEEYIAYLKAKDRWGEAARKLAEILNDDTFRSLEGKSKHQLWLELCDMVTKHPKEVEGMKVDAILRGGIRKFTDEVGRLWTSLADYYIRRGMFEKARDVYEEGLTSVITVHDFSLIFDAYTQFEESLISAKMEQMADDEDNEEGGDEEDAEAAVGIGSGEDFLLKDDAKDIDMRLARLEYLISRRPELLNSVMLRQNPHNVAEWHKRVKLFEGNATRQILTYTEAVRTVDIDKAIGKPHSLWCAFAKFYERHGDVPNARVVFEKAIQVAFKYTDDLAQVWCEWCEMELRHQNFKRALELMHRATADPVRPKRMTPEEERALPVQQRLYRSLKLWGLYVDLEESLGTIESTRAVYDRIMEHRIATPQIVLNYALYLQENKFWEDSFKVYERGVALFKYPHVKEIWQAYLQHFVQRYGGSKLERARDMFEQALAQTPPEHSKAIFLQYALLEEQHGLAKHAMEVYARAVRQVPKAERMAVYDLYLAKASEFFGIGKMREIYEKAIEEESPFELPDADIRTMGLKYAQLERKLGEIDRARAVLVHISALCDPRRDKAFWTEWKEFEVAHGNEDTFREMLRIQRSIAASYSHVQVQSTLDAAKLAAQINSGVDDEGLMNGGRSGAGTRAGLDAMAAAEAEAMKAADAAAPRSTLAGFVSAGIIQQGQNKEAGTEGKVAATLKNPEEIDIDVGDGEEEVEPEADEEGQSDRAELQTKAIPAAVFGSLAGKVVAEEEAVGALDRFKKRRVQ